MSLEIIFEDPHLLVINKPAGLFTHPPEKSQFHVPPERNCLYLLRKKYDRDLYPVHRLDAPTSGLLVFAWDKESTRLLSQQFQARSVEKTYLAVVRGHSP